jgi:hypothetical protein
MNETDFRKRVYSNPLEPDDEILEQANSDPQLSKILAEAQQMEKLLHSSLNTVAVPNDLQAKLLAIPSRDDAHLNLADKPAANANYFQHFAIAASLVLALGVSFSLTFAPEPNPNSEELAFGNQVLQHLYHEEAEITAINSGAELPTVGMSMIRNAMAPVGTQLTTVSTAMATSVKFAKPCIVIPAFESAHLILQGSQGAINVFVINNSPVNAEYAISDDRFSGMVIPTDRGNMILVGESTADLTEYKKLFSETVDWVI